MLKAVLVGAQLDLPAKERAEAEFLRSLHGDLGGPDKAREAYEAWLRISALPGLLQVDDVTRKIRWESAFEKAAWRALAQCEGAGDQAFFVIHLPKPRGG